jgi:hypothetical protein
MGEEFRELCAISVSGELAPDETTRLDEHDIRIACRATAVTHTEQATTKNLFGARA